MAKKHLKTLTVPVSWPIKKKGTKFIVRPKPGKPFSTSIPLAVVFRNLLKYCKTMKEVKTILQDNEIFVDQVRRKEPKYLLGFMDSLSVPDTKEHFRLLLTTNKKLYLLPITKEEAKLKVAKITGKVVLKKGKTQLNMYDGVNILVKKDTFKVGDSILLSLPENKITDHFKQEKGSYVFLVKGSHVGEQGVIESIEKDMVKVKTKEATFETPKDAIFIVGKGKSAVKIK